MDTSSILRLIVEQIVQEAGGKSLEQLREIHLALGSLREPPREVEAEWRTLVKFSPLSNAHLKLRRVRAEVSCMACFNVYHPQGRQLVCPVCGSVGVRVLHGEELFLESIS
jgi:Zn finger protein HypA/HybF involved in hydrogenase expression